jgi:hypothetical protein
VCIDEVSTSPESFPAKTKLDFTYYTYSFWPCLA